MENLTNRERMKQCISEVERSTAEYQTPIDDLTTSYKINLTYMIESIGIPDTARFLIREKGKTIDEVTDLIEKALSRLAERAARLGQPAVDPQIYFSSIVIEGDHNTVTINEAVPKPHQAPPEAIRDIIDEDPHRFSAGDFLRLIIKLEAHELWVDLLAMEDDWLKEKQQGPIDSKVVAFVGCLWRKNIRQPKLEPGAVPFDAATNFFKHGNNTMLKKCPSNRHISSAIRILCDLGFMKVCRAGVSRVKASEQGIKASCATYKLLNEKHWDSPAPILDT